MSKTPDLPLGRIRNIGIIAHIDAGKTTTTERILYYSGKEHRMGEVHDGNTVMDFLQDEQERGITIQSAATTFAWRNHQVNLIDTPGHVDFTAEVERSLRVLDGAVVIFDGVAGVEAQSETVWRQADRYGVPRIAYVNKLDRAGGEVHHVLDEMRQRFETPPLLMQWPVGAEDGFDGVVDLVRGVWLSFAGDDGSEIVERDVPPHLRADVDAARRRMVEAAAEADDALTEAYLLRDELDEDEIRRGIRQLTLSRRVVPVFCGSSFKYKGVQPLLDAVVDYLPSPKDVAPAEGFAPGRGPEAGDAPIVCVPSRKEPLAALAFKVQDDAHGALVYVRVYSGELRENTRVLVPVHGGAAPRKERIARLWRLHAREREALASAGPGEIVGVGGLKFAVTGDTLCDESRLLLLEPPRFPATVISMAVEADAAADRDKLADVLDRLAREDPTFTHKADDETGQLILSGMGELHLDILRTRITRDFKIPVRTGTPRVSYREGVAGPGEGTGRFEQTAGGKAHFAEVTVRVEPMATDRVPEVAMALPEGPTALPPVYARAAEEGVRGGLTSGLLGGYPLIGVRATVTSASTREGEASEIAFGAAAEAALRAALQAGGARLLEPVMKVEVTTPEEFVGGLMHDLNGRRAEINEIGSRGDLRVIHAKAPLSRMFGYATAVRGLSTGRAGYSMEPFDYQAVARGRVAEILGYDPEG